MSNKDKSHLKVPKLLPDGTNWVIFKIRLTMLITALNTLSHLDGTDVKPAEPKFSTTYKAAWTNDNWKLDKTYQTNFKNWSYVKNITKAHIATQISDSLLMQVYNSETVTKMWKTICNEYDGKTCMVSIDICRCMMALRAEMVMIFRLTW